MSHISDHPIFSSTCIQTCLYRGFVLVRGVFCLGDGLGFFVWKVSSGVTFVRPPFCQNTSITTENITFNFRFHMYEFFLKCDVTCSWTPSPPVTNCHTFSDPLPLERDVLYGRPLK